VVDWTEYFEFSIKYNYQKLKKAISKEFFTMKNYNLKVKTGNYALAFMAFVKTGDK
jgi:hypothetical protein